MGGGDPLCGLSNHEGPRLEYLKRAIVECGAVRRPQDVDFDEYGNLVWTVQDEGDGIPARDKRVIYLDAQVFGASRSLIYDRKGRLIAERTGRYAGTLRRALSEAV